MGEPNRIAKFNWARGLNALDYTCIGFFMIFSEVRMFLKKMNETNSLLFVTFVLENEHKYRD